MARYDGVQARDLKDGRRYRVVKLYYVPDALSERLTALGWRADVRRTSSYLIYGSATL
jgi:hypothetical protein